MRNTAKPTVLIDGGLLKESSYCYMFNFEATDIKCYKYYV